MINGGPVIDADGHVLEPADTWQKFIEPKYRDRAMRIERDADGLEMLLIDGRSHKRVHGKMGLTSGAVGLQDQMEKLWTPGAVTYEEVLVPGGYDPAARIKVLDEEQIDIVMLYPTLGLFWEGHVTDPLLADAYSRAYNRYIVDFCSYNRKRLIPVAHITLRDPELAVTEVQRARKDGCMAVYLSPEPLSRGGRRLDDPAYARFFDTVSDMNMPIGFHVTVREDEQLLFADYLKGGHSENNDLLLPTAVMMECMLAFTQLISAGTLERHPKLKVAVLETGSNWLSSWLERMDHKYEAMLATRSKPILKLLPSEYFERQCVISADPDETMTSGVVERFGADRVIWASDYPHLDASMNVLGTLREQIKDFPAETQRRIVGESAASFYGLAA